MNTGSLGFEADGLNIRPLIWVWKKQAGFERKTAQMRICALISVVKKTPRAHFAVNMRHLIIQYKTFQNQYRFNSPSLISFQVNNE